MFKAHQKQERKVAMEDGPLRKISVRRGGGAESSNFEV
jgi:hypothetical protein